MNHKLHLALATLACCITASTTASAFPIAPAGTEGLTVIVAGVDPVIATYQGNSASYSNDLYLMLDGLGQPGDDGNPANDLFIFNNHTSPVGSTVNLGTFTPGTELPFRLHVNNTGYNYFTGPASRNPDNHEHARVQNDWNPGETLVSFEDLFNGPFDYNDLSFSFTNTVSSANNPPDCSGALAVAANLWSPNHELSPVEIVGITDPDGDAVTVHVTGVTQDEPVNVSGDGNTCPDATIDANGNASVRVERQGMGNGRVYHIAFTADDGNGGTCSGTVRVCVPRDKGKSSTCTDDGATFNSLEECLSVDAPESLPASGYQLQVAPGTTRQIQYVLPVDSDVRISVYDVTGRQVALLTDTRQSSGTHQASWDTSSLSGGMYFIMLRAGDMTVRRTVLVTR